MKPRLKVMKVKRGTARRLRKAEGRDEKGRLPPPRPLPDTAVPMMHRPFTTRQRAVYNAVMRFWERA